MAAETDELADVPPEEFVAARDERPPEARDSERLLDRHRAAQHEAQQHAGDGDDVEDASFADQVLGVI